MTPAEQEYRRAHALVEDAIKRRDQNAIDLAADLYRASLEGIRAELKETP